MEETKKSNYNADNIVVLHGLEAVRKRPGMYIGSTGTEGLHHLIWEIVDNAIDEALSGYGDNIIITLHKDGSCSVQDEGRGIPTGINHQTGKSALDLVFSELHAGGKFSSNAYKSAGGLHGVGASVTNALSEWLDVTVYRDGEITHLRYKNGGSEKSNQEVIGKTNKHGTLVRFKPDSSIFSTVEFKNATVANHLSESSFLMKGVHFILKDERTDTTKEYYSQDGLKEYVRELNKAKDEAKALTEVMDFSGTFEGIDVEIAMQYYREDYNETISSYANNVRTKEGGYHETSFRATLTRIISDYVEKNNISRAKKLEGSDIREGLTAIISLKVPESLIEFEGQTKAKLGTPKAGPAVSTILTEGFGRFLIENKEKALEIIQKCLDAQEVRLAARATKENKRGAKKNKQEIILSNKLTPAQSKDYLKNELFIVEGDSAGGTAKKGRDRLHQAILPLRGKPLNTDSLPREKIEQNEEFATLISTIGAGFGPTFDINDIKYGKIIIMTDADTDGAHIQTLLLTFFYRYMRQLITSGHVYVAVPPLYRVFKEVNKKISLEYAWNDKDLEEAKKKVGAGYKISRYKGLGEMSETQLKETTMDPRSRLLIQVSIEDPLFVENQMNVLMGKDTAIRRQWVEENVDFNEVDKFIEEVK